MHDRLRPLLVALALDTLGATASAQAARPETGALLGLQRRTDLVFVHSLQDRGLAGSGSAAWLRTFGEKDSSTSDSGLYGVDGKLWGVQGGYDLRLRPAWLERWRFGVMAGYAGAQADGTAAGAAGTSQARGNGYGIGVYATWFQDLERHQGWYVDLWDQFAWFDNHVDTTGLARADYKSHNGSASAEAGYAIGLGADGAWTLTPQLQWMYIHNHSYNFVESDGTMVDGAHRGGWSTRLGLTLQRQVDQAQAQATGMQLLRPYAAINWWHDALGDEVVYNQALSIKDLYPKDRFELKGGANLRLAGGWRAWGDIGWQTGSQSYRAWTASIGARYAW